MTLSLDLKLEVLQRSERRQLAEELLAAGPEETIDVADPSVSDYHLHLPKLAAYEVIEWDQETGQVRRGAAFEEVEPLLQFLRENQCEAHPAD